MKKIFPRFIVAFFFFMVFQSISYAQQVMEEKKNSFSIFGIAEYGFNTKSVAPSPVPFQDGFFHSAGFYYRRSFHSRWYIQPGISYTQILWSDVSRADPATTQKVHRIGISFSAGYYVYNRNRWSIGIGGGIQALYNLAAVQWQGTFSESTVLHLNGNDFYSFGMEINVHAIFSYRVHKNWEVYASPVIHENLLPVFKITPDNTFRAGLTLGAGYLF